MRITGRRHFIIEAAAAAGLLSSTGCELPDYKPKPPRPGKLKSSKSKGSIRNSTERKLGFSLDSRISYAPTVDKKRGSIFASSSDSPFAITRQGQGVSGIYVPINYLHSFDGGWRIERPTVDARRYNVEKVGVFGQKQTLDVNITADVLPSFEFKGYFPLVVPALAIPNEEFVRSLRKKGHEVYIDDIGRFFSTTPVNKLKVDYYPGSISRQDKINMAEYAAFPEDLAINTNGETWEGLEISGNYIIEFQPTYLRRDGTSFSRLKKTGVGNGQVPTAWRGDRDAFDRNRIIITNLLLANRDSGLEEQIAATREHYSYPDGYDERRITSEQYKEALEQYYSSEGKKGMNLLEFLNIMLVADCDVANAEMMMRLRTRGVKTRLGNGYKTGKNGKPGQLHGWCEAVGRAGKVEGWVIKDATPTVTDWDSNKSLENAKYMRRITS